MVGSEGDTQLNCSLCGWGVERERKGEEGEGRERGGRGEGEGQGSISSYSSSTCATDPVLFCLGMECSRTMAVHCSSQLLM